MAGLRVSRVVVAAVLSLLLIAALAYAEASRAPVKGARYSGSVGPGYPMSFRVSSDGHHVDDLVVAFDETCSAGAGNEAPKFRYATLAIEHDTFSGESTDQFGPTVSDALRIKGTFDGSTATGHVTDASHIKGLGNCTQTEPFTATAR